MATAVVLSGGHGVVNLSKTIPIQGEKIGRRALTRVLCGQCCARDFVPKVKSLSHFLTVLEKHLVQVPLVTGPGTPTTELIGIVLAKFAAPLANGLIGHDHTTFEQQFFDIAEAQAEAEVQPHGVADNFSRKAMVLIVAAWGWGGHAATLTHRMGV